MNRSKYVCSTSRKNKALCTTHYIKEDELVKLLTADIHFYENYLIMDETALKNNIIRYIRIRQNGNTAQYSERVKQIDVRLNEIPDVRKRLFEEKLYLVQTDTPTIRKKRIHTDELDSFRELYLSWDEHYQFWHDRWMAESPRAHIQADAIGILELLWNRPDNWIIAPESVVVALAKQRPVFVSELVNQPPNRVCYRIRHRYPKLTSQKAVEIFENALSGYLASRHTQIPVGAIWQL